MENKVLAIVNGKEITENDLDLALTKYPAEMRTQFSTEEGRKYLLDQVISYELLYTYGLEEGFEAKDEYKAQLEEAKRGIISQMIMSDVVNNIKVSDEEVEAFYFTNKDNFMEPEMVRASHILVDSEEKAKDVIEEIKNGLDFKEAAKKYSSCPSKDQGGVLGSFGRGMMVPEFEEAAFDLEIGKISEPVKTQFGYHVVLVEERIPEKIKPLNEVKPQVMQQIMQTKRSEAVVSFIDGLKGKYEVKEV